MSTPAKSTSLQTYRLVLYRRALHPELFRVKARRVIEHNGYEFETWVMPGSHLLRFQIDGECATELITDQEDSVPDRGIVAALPCAGERDHEEKFSDKINYAATLQTEQLPESLYRATYEELLEFGRENDALIHEWVDSDGGRCGSIIDVQRYRNEVHAQGYHLMSQGGLILRTQCLFELVKAEKAKA